MWLLITNKFVFFAVSAPCVQRIVETQFSLKFIFFCFVVFFTKIKTRPNQVSISNFNRWEVLSAAPLFPEGSTQRMDPHIWFGTDFIPFQKPLPGLAPALRSALTCDLRRLGLSLLLISRWGSLSKLSQISWTDPVLSSLNLYDSVRFRTLETQW